MPIHLTTPAARRGVRQRASRILCAVFSIAILSACASSPSVPPHMGVTVNDLTGSPANYSGRIVTVSGEVNRIYGEHIFSIGGDDYFEGAELLVLGNSTLPSLVSQVDDSTELLNDIVQVTGTVRMFDEAQTEFMRNIDIHDRLLDDRDENTPIIIATEIDLTARTDVVPVAVATVVPMTMPDSMIMEPIVDAIIIVDAPDRVGLAGRSAALIGVTVQTVVSEHAFWVGPDPDRQLFVTMDAGVDLDDEHMKIEPGQTIAIAGVLRRLPADLSSMQSKWSLTAANLATLRQELIYLDAQRTEVLEPISTAAGASMKP